jgi:Sulfatase
MRPRVAALVAVVALLAGAGLVVANNHSGDDENPKPPEAIVMLILDEFPADSLLLPNGRVDAARFPNFARLAATSNFYEHATTVYDSTFKAVPSILDARLPKQFSKPDTRSHPKSVYTLMHDLGVGIVDVQSAEALCSPSICPGKRTRRPGVLDRLRGGGRPGRLRKWIRSIKPRDRPYFYMQHALFPHEPWLYLPSGRQSRPVGNDPVEGINKPEGFHDPDLSLHNHARYMLQLGYTDRELGVLMDQLRDQGLFDKALLVVTADHGYAFQMGLTDRRKVVPSNIDKIASVPLFVKLPHQRKGRVDSTYVHNIDIVPTLADVIGTSLDWEHDGRSLLDPRPPATEVSMISRDFKKTIRIGTEAMEARRRGEREHWAEVFLTGAESRRRYGSPWAGVYRVGPNQHLIGRRIGAVPRGSAVGRIANGELLRDVRPSEPLVPTRVAGRLLGGRPPGVRRDLAAAVNGRIQAVGRSFSLKGSRKEWFSLIVPERSIRRGRNRIDLLEVRPDGELRRLASAP